MKILFAAALVSAVSVLSGPAVAQDRFDWTGGYVGAHVGYGSLDATHNQTNGGMDPKDFSIDDDSGLAGLSAGFNRQLGSLVLGVEAEAGYMDIEGEGRIPSSTPPNYQALDVDTGLYGLVAGRVGFAINHTLIYGKGGYAWLEGDAGQKTTKPGYSTQRSDNLEGFVYGAGIEHALTDRLSIKAEYLRFDLDDVSGSQTSITDAPIGFVYTNKTSDIEIDTVKVGLNYRF